MNRLEVKKLFVVLPLEREVSELRAVHGIIHLFVLSKVLDAEGLTDTIADTVKLLQGRNSCIFISLLL